jgi:DNA mismatch repair protein MutS2
LHRSLDSDGAVLDSASPALRDIRRQMAAAEKRLERQLDVMVKDANLDGVLQERFVTVRNGRYVIPIRREQRGSFPGIVHDHSNSGQTVFVEPADTLPLGNELAELRLQERDEVRRVLAALSERVRSVSGSMAVNQEVLADIDAAAAVARWSHSFGCVLPGFGRSLQLVKARHPLLQKTFREEGNGATVVPLDVELDPGTRVLLITGSNTGGKTVALKTIGLLTLAAQSGLPVPVSAESQFVIFDGVFADIGDEQSLQNSLSTFSAHMKHITDVLTQAERGRMLVLLDELGAGTDPLEGGALACAILSDLARHNALTVATTHLGVVKNFAHERQGMVNAAVRFDVETLQPEYVLEVGRPGASHALLIARRLGLPQRVLKTAEGMMSSDHLRLEEVLAKMEEDQRKLASREDEMKGAREELLRDRDAAKKELEELRKERRRLMHDAYRQAAGIVDNARAEMERRLDALQMAFKDAQQEKEKHAETVKTIRRKIADKGRRIAKGIEQTEPKPAKPVDPETLQVGDRVWIPRLKSHGTIQDFTDDRAKVGVDVDGLRFSVRTGELDRPREDAPDPDQGKTVVKVSRPRVQGRTPSEVNLIGLRVDEAIDRLEHFLDHALMAGQEEVRVVHGFGTGRLQKGVHDWLRRRREVTSFRLGKQGEDPGGAGATIIRLA